jgi:TolA-binding protein
MAMHMMLNFRGAWPCLVLAVSLGGLAGGAQAALFEDDEARRAILDLRQRLEQTNKNLTEENAQLRRSLLDLQSQIENLRNDVSQSRGAQENLARDLSEVQRNQKDVAAGVDERLRKFEPIKVNLDGREFLAEPAEKRDYEVAMDIFRKGDFVAAQAALVQFLQRNGKSGYALQRCSVQLSTTAECGPCPRPCARGLVGDLECADRTQRPQGCA